MFADSSALVKLYADEEGHESVRALCAVAVAQVARVEVPAAIWRKHRIGELGAAAASVLVAAFESDFFGSQDREPRFAAVATDLDLLDDAARLTGVHGLRAYDAVQLASARTVARLAPEFGGFAAYDHALRAAAAAEGFSLLG